MLPAAGLQRYSRRLQHRICGTEIRRGQYGLIIYHFAAAHTDRIVVAAVLEEIQQLGIVQISAVLCLLPFKICLQNRSLPQRRLFRLAHQSTTA